MRYRLLFMLVIAALSLAADPAQAQSNTEPSLHVALHPCHIYSGYLTGNSTTNINVRGVCGIPETATAVEVAITVSSSANGGSLKLWEYDSSAPSFAIMNYEGGSTVRSSFGVPRLCAPAAECYLDISARSSETVYLTLVAVGYYEPAQ